MTLDLDALAEEIDAFSDERDWRRVHTPMNLVMALAVEASELLELFQWATPEESEAIARSEAAADEVADVLIYLVRFAALNGMDLAAAVRSKMAKNEVKHAASEVRT